jgi:hypothetical protein
MALVDLLTDLSNFNWNYESAGVNNSQISDRHGQEPDFIHPEEHTLQDDGAGTNLSQISGRHGGVEGAPHPEEHSKFDDGVGFGVAPNDNPQTFDVRGYTITGTKTFDRPNQEAITIMTNRLGFPYTPSDFQTTPIEAYSSIFATQDGLIMDTIYDSGFNRGDMYIKDHLHQPHPEFKEFSRTDTSLKRIKLDSPNFDSDGNEKFTFKDRIPYNIPARDNNVIGFDQPFILKDIGDRWGPGKLGAIDEGLFRGGFVTSAARTVADVLRIGKFLLTPKGIMFGLKQVGLQLLNPRKETTIWNPLSLIGSVAPMVHMDRHFGTATEGFGYESVINFGLATFGFRPNSILYGYGTAVNLPTGNLPAIAAVTTTRVTGAHIVGMVPSAGGVPGTFPSIPEIDIDLSGGNITSLTVKPSNKYGPKTLLGNKKYTVSDGTPIIPARNPEAGFKSGILGGRFGGSQLTQMFLSEDGLFPSEALTDAVIGNKFKGDHWGPDRPGGTYEQFAFTNIGDRKYVQLFGGGDLQIGALTVKTHADDKHDVYSTEPLQGTITIPQFSLTKDMARPFQTPIFRTNVFKGDLYKKGTEYSKDYVYTVSDSHISITHKAIRTVAYKDAFHEDDTVLGAEKTYTVDLTKLPVPIKIAGVFQSDKYSKSLPYATSDSEPSLATIQSEEGPLIQLGHSSSVMALKNIIYIHSNFPLEGAKLGEPFKVITKLDHESDGKESKVFGEYPAIKLASQTHWHDGKNIYNTDDKYIITEIMSGRKDGRLPPSDEKRKQLFIGKEFWQTNIFGGAGEPFEWKSDKWNKGAPYATSDSTPTLAKLQSATGEPIQLGHPFGTVLKHIVHRSDKTAVGPLFDSLKIPTIFDHESAGKKSTVFQVDTKHSGNNIWRHGHLYLTGIKTETDGKLKHGVRYPTSDLPFGLTVKGGGGEPFEWQSDKWTSLIPYGKDLDVIQSSQGQPIQLGYQKKVTSSTQTVWALKHVVHKSDKDILPVEVTPEKVWWGVLSRFAQESIGKKSTVFQVDTKHTGKNIYKKDTLYLSDHGTVTGRPPSILAALQAGVSIGKLVGDPIFENKVTAYTDPPPISITTPFPSTGIPKHDGTNFYKKDTLYLSDHGTGTLIPIGKLAADQAGVSIGQMVGSPTFKLEYTTYPKKSKIRDGGFKSERSKIIYVGPTVNLHGGKNQYTGGRVPTSYLKGKTRLGKWGDLIHGLETPTKFSKEVLYPIAKFAADTLNYITDKVVGKKFIDPGVPPTDTGIIIIPGSTISGTARTKAEFGVTVRGEFGKKSFWDGDLYSSEEPYTKFIGSSKEQSPSSPLEFTGLQIDSKTKDPTVVIKTAHPHSSARFQTAGDSTLKKPIKLQNFPLLNKEGSAWSFGLEGQALGFVDDAYGLLGNLFGVTTRKGSGRFFDRYTGKVNLSDSVGNKGQLLKVQKDLAQNIVDDNIVIDRPLFYRHKNIPDFSPIQNEAKIEIKTDGTNKYYGIEKVTKNLGEELAIKTTAVAVGSGNLIDTYSTLAYGKLSVTKTDEAGTDDQGIHKQLNYEKTLRSASEINKSFSGGRGEIIESESSRFGVSGGENVGRRDRAKQWKADDQGHPGKPDPTGAVWKIVNDDGLKGLVKKSFDDKYITALTDKINMLRYGEDYDVHGEDFIKFKFRDVINDKWIIFRATLGSISEEFSPEWSSEKYIGRPDQVHVYQGVNRSLSFEFMVVPHTRQELPILWEKLNYLVGLTYPTWKSVGDFGKRMEAPFINLTIGDMYNEVPGFLNGLSIAVDDNATWEIEEGFQLPKAINVSCEFTHIGRHVLASQGKHYGLGWLKTYDNTPNWTDGDSHLGGTTDQDRGGNKDPKDSGEMGTKLKTLLNLPLTKDQELQISAEAMHSFETGASDIELKENIELVGKSPSGINIYEFNYKDEVYGEGRYVGVIAQEVPEASVEMSNGYLAVDYSKIDVDFIRV